MNGEEKKKTFRDEKGPVIRTNENKKNPEMKCDL
jgi:hypothetical protein